MKFQVGSASVEMIERGDRVCWHLTNGGSFEPATLAVWGRLCTASKGKTVIDVGAYSGLFAISAAMLGCDVHAFEPMPLNAKRIVNNAHENAVRDRIRLHRLALSDTDGVATINFNSAVPGLTSGASIVNEKLGKIPANRIKVQTRTLDSYGFENVAAIKIDVERAEPEVLRGAIETLKRCRPTIIVEVLGNAEKSAVKAAVAGYEVAEVLDERNWLMVPVA